jgi:aconitase B
METTRTKQQTAFDGVQVVWHRDAFTEILQQQVQTKFSMDGVIPHGVVSTRFVRSVVNKEVKVPFVEKKRFAGLVGTMDGIRVPLQQSYAG